MEEINKITKEIIGKSFRVSNSLGDGFLEKVYENALAYELKKSGLIVYQQYPLEVYYEDQIVGSYFADIVVENRVLVELKAVKKLDDIHLAQILHYLKACNFKLGLLINFGSPSVEIKRVVNGF
ncbi:GxxExxY protein [Aquiflexum lacus]|jgi:GxxExxY protein|uniref:GxxExxY protein n=1 Tax=Aquiflexum lacus TaxID=2483805 RepID=UPI001894662F|nr:GxxExxY protein [Aquiflexum lacus]